MIKVSICVGCGLKVSGTGLLEVQLRPGGGLDCDNSGDANDGLFVTAASTTGSNCIDVVGGVVSVNLSEDACNGLQCRANGLYAPCPDSETGINSQGSANQGDIPLNVNTGGAATFDLVTIAAVSICNPTCCTASGRISVMSGGIFIDADPGYLGSTNLQISIDGGGFASSPVAEIWCDNNTASIQRFDLNNLEDDFWSNLGSGACTTVAARIRTVVSAGTGTINGILVFETQWDLNQTGCC